MASSPTQAAQLGSDILLPRARQPLMHTAPHLTRSVRCLSSADVIQDQVEWPHLLSQQGLNQFRYMRSSTSTFDPYVLVAPAPEADHPRLFVSCPTAILLFTTFAPQRAALQLHTLYEIFASHREWGTALTSPGGGLKQPVLSSAISWTQDGHSFMDAVVRRSSELERVRCPQGSCTDAFFAGPSHPHGPRAVGGCQ